MLEVGAVLIAVLISYLLLPGLLKLLRDGNAVQNNYRGYEVVLGGGLLFVFVYLFVALWVITLADQQLNLSLMLLLILGFSLVGLVDDLLGKKGPRGYRGHFGALIKKKEITSGFLKALWGAVIALYIALFLERDPIRVFLNSSLIVLTANSFNLLDRQPGRAIKVFVFFTGIFVFFTGGIELLLLLPLLASLIVYLPYELSEEIMLGDTGANSLGGALGLYTVLAFDTRLKAILIFFLFIFQLFCEKYSISKLVEKNPFLYFFDKLGRQ